MPEISNNFRLGRMEKDLDDRLVPNGAYRDALNVEVATSEGSDVGALQKVLGNTKKGTIGSMSNPVCIGSVRDTENNKIYWFITSDSRDVIAEYDEAAGTIAAVLVDNGSNLKFNASNLITGVNVLDGVLYFTDNLNEPKEVDISFWKNQTVDFATQSTNLSEDKITVIKKSPLEALEYKVLSNTVVTGYGTNEPDSIPIKIKVGSSTEITLSTLSIGTVIENITFVQTDSSSTAIPSQATNLTYRARDTTNNIPGSKVILTNENGGRAVIEILTKDDSSSVYVFTAELIHKDDDLQLVEDTNQVGQSSTGLINIVGSGLTGHDTVVISPLTVFKYGYVTHPSGTGSLKEFTIGADANYDLFFEIKTGATIALNNGTQHYFQLVIYKNNNEIIFRDQPRDSSNNPTQAANTVVSITKTNVTLLNGDTVGFGVVFTTGVDTQGVSDPVLDNSGSEQFQIASSSGLGSSFDYSITTTDVTSEYTAVAEQVIGNFEKKFPRFSYRYKYDNNQYSTYAPFSEIAFVPGLYEYDTKNGFNLAMRNTISALEVQNFRNDIPQKIKEIDILYKDTVDQNVYIVDTVNKSSQTFTGDGSNKAFTLTTSGFSDPLPNNENQLIVKINNVVIGRESYTYSSPTLTFVSASFNSTVQESDGAPKNSLSVVVEGFQESLQIKDEEIYKVVDAMQLLRPFDNVPKKALAQEIIGNRLVYANYTENYDYNLTPVFSISLNSTSTAKVNGAITDATNISVDNNSGTIAVGDIVTGSGISGTVTVSTVTDQNTLALSSAQTLLDNVNLSFRAPRADTFNQKLSLKSNRTYQLGVVFIDEYGRKTPVFTGNTGQFVIETKEASNTNFIEVSTSTTAPTGITHFQYYIKEPSLEYHNLAISNFYDDAKGFLYLMCSSADINKLKAEDYISLKKKNGIDEDFVIPNNKFKVVDILAKTPDFLAKTYEVSFASNYVIFGDNYVTANSGAKTTKTAGFTPVKDFNKVLIKDIDIGGGIPDTYRTTYLVVGAKVRFVSNGSRSKSNVYEISAVTFPVNTTPNPDVYGADLQFTESFGDDINFLYDTNSDTSPITGVGIEFLNEVDNRGNQAFDNKFFVKVKNGPEIAHALKSEISQDDLTVISSAVLELTGTTTTSAAVARSYFYESPGNNSLTIVTGKAYDNSDSAYFADGFSNNLKINNYIRISNTNFKNTGVDFSKVHKIINVQSRPAHASGSRKTWILTFEENLPSAVSTSLSGSGSNRIDIMNVDDDDTGSLTNPAVIEVIPDNGLLDLYYEDKDIFPIAELGNTKTLTYSNCISFGNGVECDRIRDDFNAPTIGKGIRVSTVFEEAYNEEVQTNRFIFSGIYNANSSVNRLNQFIIADKITKDINPAHGSIQLIKTRDTDLLALCEDKCFRIQANKDALFTADGNANVTASSNVLGQVIPYIGEYGISQNPESFAQYGFRAYFADKARGVVLRLSRDGLSEISASGMSDFFSDKLANVTSNLFGSYDDRKNSYNLSFTNQANSDTTETISFNERVNGWTSRMSFVPETGISLNNQYFTFKNGDIYKHHDNSNHSEFYGVTLTNKCTVKFVMNQPIGQIKRFKTLNYLGDLGWLLDSLTTSESVGTLGSDGFVKKEGKFFATLTGTNSAAGTLNAEELQVEGLGTLSSVAGSVLTFTGGVNSNLQVGDSIYFLADAAVAAYTSSGTCTAKTATTVTVSGTAPAQGKFVLFDKGGVANQSGLLGFFAEVELKHITTTAAELFSVGSRIV